MKKILRTTVQALMIFAVIGLMLPVFGQAKPGGGSNTPKGMNKEERAAEAKKAADMAKKGFFPIPIKLPKAMFVGTPKNIKSANLRKESGKKRLPFYAPKDVKNVAKGKEISGSDEEPIIGEMELITDGDKEGGDGSFVEFGPGRQYVQIDLEQKCEIFAVVLWHYHSEPRVYQDLIVRTADDPDFIMNVQDLFNNDHDNSSGLGVGKIDKEFIETNDGYLVDGKLKTGKNKGKQAVSQYVRLYTNGNTSNELNHYIEVEVWARPAK